MTLLAAVPVLLCLKATAVIEYKDTVSLTLRLFGIPLWRFPKRPKAIRPSAYSKAAMKRRQRNEQKKAEQAKKKAAKQRKKNKASPQGEQTEKGTSLLDNLNFILSIVKLLCQQLSRHVRARVVRFILTVSTPDAATTAILYGAAHPIVLAILALLDSVTTVEKKESAQIAVRADFTSERTTADIHIVFSLRVWHFFVILLHVAKHILNHQQTIQNSQIRKDDRHAS